MHALREKPTVKETDQLEPWFPQVKDAVFGSEAIFVNWRGSQTDQATFKWKRADGVLWLPAKGELWLVELEWKLGSNYLDQAKTFAEGTISDHTFRQELTEGLRINAAALGIPEDTRTIKLYVDLVMERYIKKETLRPNMWVVLGHDGDNAGELLEQYKRVTSGWFGKGGRQYVITLVRWFSNGDSDYLLLDSHRHDESHDCILFPLTDPRSYTSQLYDATPSARRDVQDPGVEQRPSGPRSQTKGGRPARRTENRAEEVWAWFQESHPGLRKEDVWLRIVAGSDCHEDFEIAWDHPGPELQIVHKNRKGKPRKVAGPIFRARGVPDLGKNVAQSLGQYVDVSKDPPEVIASVKSVEEQRTRFAGGYDSWREETRPCSDFFENPDRHQRILSLRRLWRALLEKRVITTIEFVELSGITGKGRSATLDHKLVRYSIVVREGLELRLTEEAVAYVEKLVAELDGTA